MPMSGISRRKAALVVVDMAEADRQKISWPKGCAEEGIMRLSSAMAAAAGEGISTVFVMDREGDRPLHELSAYAPRALRFPKNGFLSAFSSEPFRRYLDLLNPDALIVAGWVGNLCVRATAIDALKDGYLVHSSEDLLFHRTGTIPLPMMGEPELRMHAGLITMHRDAASLVAGYKSL